LGINFLDDADQLFNELAYLGSAAPPHDIGGYFIYDAESEDGRMAATEGRGLADAAAGLFSSFGRIKKTEVFVPGNVDEQAQTVGQGKIQEPFRRQPVGTEDICSQIVYQLEVVASLLWGGEELSTLVGCERSIGDSLDVKLLVTDAEEFSIDLNSKRGFGEGSHSVSGFRGETKRFVRPDPFLALQFDVPRFRQVHDLFGSRPQV
jgi:hypothetical protein